MVCASIFFFSLILSLHSLSSLVVSQSLLELLQLARPDLPAAQLPDWLLQLNRHFSSEMALVFSTQDLAQLKDICTRFERLPRSTTVRIFLHKGIVLGDPLHSAATAVLYHGRQGSMPLILKKLDAGELVGYTAINRLDKGLRTTNHLVPFDLFKAVSPLSTPSASPPAIAPASSHACLTGGVPLAGNSLLRTPMKPSKSVGSSSSSSSPSSPVASAGPEERDWCSMPHFPITLDGFARPLAPIDSSKLILHMCAALRLLHNNSLAHMDVKPSNIFVDHQGDFWLADFGSVRPSGCCSNLSTTAAFVPRNLRVHNAPFVASSQHDHWMLAMTVADMVTARAGGAVGAGATDPTSTDVIAILGRLDTAEATALLAQLAPER